MAATVQGSGEFEGFDGDGVGGATSGEHGEQRPRGGADDGDVGGAGIDDKEQVASGGKGQGGGTVADVDGARALAIVDGVDGDHLGAKIADVEHGVVAGDESADGIVADHSCAADVIGAGDDLGDGIGKGVDGEELAAVGLQGQLHGATANVHQGFETVGLGRIGFRVGEGDDHDLVAAGAGYKRFR